MPAHGVWTRAGRRALKHSNPYVGSTAGPQPSHAYVCVYVCVCVCVCIFRLCVTCTTLRVSTCPLLWISLKRWWRYSAATSHSHSTHPNQTRTGGRAKHSTEDNSSVCSLATRDNATVRPACMASVRVCLQDYTRRPRRGADACSVQQPFPGQVGVTSYH